MNSVWTFMFFMYFGGCTDCWCLLEDKEMVKAAWWVTVCGHLTVALMNRPKSVDPDAIDIPKKQWEDMMIWCSIQWSLWKGRLWTLIAWPNNKIFIYLFIYLFIYIYESENPFHFVMRLSSMHSWIPQFCSIDTCCIMHLVLIQQRFLIDAQFQ